MPECESKSPLDELRRKHHDLVVEAIVEFQLLEERLKSYIHLTYELVDEWLDKSVPFSYDKSEIENAPLGKLLRQFRHFCTNESLVEVLSSLVPDRNYVAHRGFLAFRENVDIPEGRFIEEIARVEDILTRLHSTRLSWWMVNQQYAALTSGAYGGNEVETQMDSLQKISHLANEVLSSVNDEDEYQKTRTKLHECLRQIRKIALETSGDPVEFGEGPCGL